MSLHGPWERPTASEADALNQKPAKMSAFLKAPEWVSGSKILPHHRKGGPARISEDMTPDRVACNIRKSR